MNKDLLTAGIAAAVCFGIYKYAPSAMVKTAAVGAMGVIIAKQIPYVQDVI